MIVADSIVRAAVADEVYCGQYGFSYQFIADFIWKVYLKITENAILASLGIGLPGAATLVSGTLPGSDFWIFAVCCFFIGSAGTFVNIPVMAYIRESTAPEMIGKVFSLLMTVMTLVMPFGLLFAGPAAEIVGVNTWFF